MFYDVAMNFVIGTILMVAGAIMLCIPNRVFTWILVVSILFLFANGVTLFIRFIKNKKEQRLFLFNLIVCVYVFLDELSLYSTMDLASEFWWVLYSLWFGLFYSTCD